MVRQIASPLRVGHRQPLRRGPFRGEHTETLLMEICGYSADRVAELRTAGALGK